MAQPPPAAAAATLVSDPRYLPPRDELEVENPQYLKDQRAAYKALPSQIVWHSAPFSSETVLAGRPRLQLQLAIDQPDADLFASLYEVLPSGEAIALASTSVRLRYRNGGTAPAAMVPGKPERVAFPAFRFFARAIAKGSRLRLVVDAGPRLGWQRNTHTGGDLASEPLSRARTAQITVMTGPDSGSSLSLPRPDEAIVPRTAEPSRHP